MQLQTDRALIPAGADAIRYLTIKITAPEARARTARAAASVALVLDRSGSMAGSKMTMARKAVEHAIRLLDARDQLAVVVYDTEVDTILQRVSATEEAKALATKRLAKIDARGGTDLAAGWLQALNEVGAGEPPSGTAVSRVLLLSDGLANEGITDQDELARRAAEFRARGIATSTFGVGADFDEVLMSRLATAGGGHFYYIENARQIPDLLASELGETLEVVARDAFIELRSGAGVTVVVLNELASESDAGVTRIRLGDLVAGQEHTVVLAVRCAPRALDSAALVECRTVDRDAALFRGALSVEWTAVVPDADRDQPLNAAVVIAAAELIAERGRADALELNRAGRLDEAAALLKRVAVEINAMLPGDRRIVAIADTLEEDMPEFALAMSAPDLKARHFASYSARAGRTPEGGHDANRRKARKCTAPSSVSAETASTCRARHPARTLAPPRREARSSLWFADASGQEERPEVPSAIQSVIWGGPARRSRSCLDAAEQRSVDLARWPAGGDADAGHGASRHRHLFVRGRWTLAALTSEPRAVGHARLVARRDGARPGQNRDE